MEEIGVNINLDMISNPNDPIEVIYYTKKKEIHKKVYLYLVDIKSLDEIGLAGEIVPKNQLQLSEVDWAGFMTKEEIELKGFHRFRSLVNMLS